jgi:hypothetical protein
MATAPKISNLPAAPNRQQPANFSAKGDALLSSLQGFATEANALGDFVEEKAGQVAIDKAAVDANVPLLNDAKAAAPLAFSYRDTAKTYRDAAATSEAKALQYKNDLASAVVYQDLASIALFKNITMIDGCIDTSPNPPLAVQRRTSWYNEALGTATRGTRRELPAKRIIIVEANFFGIYDGDDPTFPLWWGRQGSTLNSGSNFFYPNYNDGSSVKACGEGKILFGLSKSNTNGGIRVLDFGADRIMRSTASANATGYIQPLASAQTEKVTADPSVPTLRNNAVYAVTSVVLDDAPIDTASGMRVPTYILGSTGIEVLRHDGTRINSANAANPSDGIIVLDNKAIHHRYGASLSSFIPFPEWLEDQFPYTLKVDNVGHSSTNIPVLSSPQPNMCADGSDVLSQIASLGIARIRPNYHDYARSMVACTASEYATGWMVGDAKGAWLSSVDTTELVGSGELVTNGTFDVDVNGWGSPADGRSTPTWAAGKIRVKSESDRAYAYTFQTITGLVVGAAYTVQWTVSAIDATYATRITVSTNEGGSNVSVSQAASVVGPQTHTFVATTSSVFLTLSVFTAANGVGMDFDNVSLKLADPDRSVKNKGLIVNGTITRTPVATGAELVGYSGFSASNYLEQPYNPDLDFGTGDFCVMGWVAPNLGTQRIVQRSDGGSGVGDNGSWAVLVTNSGWAFQTPLGLDSTGVDYSLDIFSFFAVVIQEGVMSFYVNGKLIYTKSRLYDLNGVGAPVLRVGSGFFGGATDSPLKGPLSLLRIGATAPTPEQIDEVYHGERPMFQPNAKVTLHGTSNLISSLAHDKSTGLIHAGTSAGRSDFSGLVRVGETNTPITTKIVAHDGMILEQ